MAELDISTGFDTWVSQTNASQNNSTGRYPAVKGGGSDQYQIFLSMPLSLSALSGRTILAATLSAPAQGNWISQTLSVQACSASWNVGTLKWSNRPGVTGSIVTDATGALSAGQRFEIDVTTLIQAIADGQANYGWRITTSQSTARSTLRGFDSGAASWKLHIEVSDLLAKPTDLAPVGVIGVAKPVLLVDDLESLSAIQVQIDADATGAADFDSGWVASTKPQLNLASTAYAGLADGATTYWRTRLKTTNGSVSAWSDWVAITRANKPTVVMDNPSGTDLWDPTPTIAAHLSPAGSAETRWQVIVQSATDPTDVRYNSGDHISGATLDHDIPLRWKGRKVFPTDGDYALLVKAWDRTDRVPSPGDPTFTKALATVTLAADAAVTAPNSLVLSLLTTGYPDVVVGWERASDPDRFVVWRDGEIIKRLDPDDVRTAPGVFEWVDTTAAPNVEHTYKVRAVTDVGGGVMKQSPFSPAENIVTDVRGVWIRTATEDLLLLDEDGPPEVRRVDKRQTFDLPYSPENVDIVTAVGYYEGSYAGVVDHYTHDLPATLSLIEELIGSPSVVVRLVWSTFNIPCRLPGLTYSPHKDSLVTAPKYLVALNIKQTDEPDE